MRIIRRFIPLLGLTLLQAIPAPSSALAQSNPEERGPAINIQSLLDEAGYKYVKGDESQWRITEIPYRDATLKINGLYLFTDSSKNVLIVRLRLGAESRSADDAELKERLKDLSERFKPVGFATLNKVLLAAVEIPNDKLDKDILTREIMALWSKASKAHPELAKFMEQDLKPSYGPGEGGGMGVGEGKGVGPRNPDASNEPARTYVTSRPDTRPVLLNRVRPEYTDQARENKTQGTVRLRMLVDETGRVKQARITSGLPDGLNEKAMEAAYKMRFKPATKDGKEVATWIAIEVTFALR